MPSTWRPRTLSVSAVQCYVDCPAAYRRRYIERIQDPPTGALGFGRAMATALEALHRGQDAEVAWLKAYMMDVVSTGAAGAASLEHGLKLLAAYQASGIGTGEPERRFEVYLPDREAVPVPVVGIMDLAGPEGVMEFKTSRAKWDQGRCDRSPQAALYRYGYWQVFGRKPQWVEFVVLHTQRVEVQRFRTYPAGPELRLFELQAAFTWRGIVAGQFPPKCGRCAACGVSAAPVVPSGYPSLELPE